MLATTSDKNSWNTFIKNKQTRTIINFDLKFLIS